ncbi:unnamed protein product, partial [Didymodactylos carnosus]
MTQPQQNSPTQELLEICNGAIAHVPHTKKKTSTPHVTVEIDRSLMIYYNEPVPNYSEFDQSPPPPYP